MSINETQYNNLSLWLEMNTLSKSFLPKHEFNHVYEDCLCITLAGYSVK